jgi:hypothetical protein
VTNKEYVTCSVCGRTFKGFTPKGGDGSVLFPRTHWTTIPVTTSMGIMPKKGKKIVCPGSYREAVGQYSD